MLCVAEVLVMFSMLALIVGIVSTKAIDSARVHHQAANAVQVHSQPCHHQVINNRSLHYSERSGNSSLHHKNTSLQAKNESRQLPGAGTQFPEGHWEPEDFNPANAPDCGGGQVDGMNGPSSAEGDPDYAPPQQQVIAALKKVVAEMTKDTSDSATACAKLDKDGNSDISKQEFNEWVKSQIYLKATMTDDDMRDAVFDAFGNSGAVTASKCKAVVKEYGTMLSMHLRGPH